MVCKSYIWTTYNDLTATSLESWRMFGKLSQNGWNWGCWIVIFRWLIISNDMSHYHINIVGWYMMMIYIYILYCWYIPWYRVLKKTVILLHVVTSHLIPPALPWSMLLPNACRHPNRNGFFFFEGLSKQSDVTTFNWEKGACKFLCNECDRMAVFLKNPVSPLNP